MVRRGIGRRVISEGAKDETTKDRGGMWTDAGCFVADGKGRAQLGEVSPLSFGVTALPYDANGLGMQFYLLVGEFDAAAHRKMVER